MYKEMTCCQTLGFHGYNCFWYRVVTVIQTIIEPKKIFPTDIFNLADQNSFPLLATVVEVFSCFKSQESRVISLFNTPVIYETKMLSHTILYPSQSISYGICNDVWHGFKMVEERLIQGEPATFVGSQLLFTWHALRRIISTKVDFV